MRVLRKRRFPIAATAVLALLALAAMGLVYSNWGQSLQINGSVQTAEINVKWVAIGKACPDSEEGVVGGKNIATTTRNLVDPVNGKSDKVTITTTNGYPGYSAKCNVTIRNNGKLPVRVGGLTFKPVGKDGTGNLTGCSTVVATGTKNIVTSASVNCNQITVLLTNGQAQINGGAQDVFSVTLNVTKQAQPATKYDFQLQFCVEPAINSNQCVTKTNG